MPISACCAILQVLSQARSVILASGTLAPVQALLASLFPTVPPSRITHFACGHVVPRRSLAVVVAAKGPGGTVLDLRHGRRSDPRVMDEVRRAWCDGGGGGAGDGAP